VPDRIDFVRDRVAALNTEARDKLSRRVDAEISRRETRRQLFGAGIFRDPAWDILIELYKAHLAGQETTVSNLTMLGYFPQTTGLRHLARLVDNSIAIRTADEFDHRRIFVTLTKHGLSILERYFIGPNDDIQNDAIVINNHTHDSNSLFNLT